MDLSILVISYNTCELTLACLRSVIKHTRDSSYELIVVDNASTDGSADAIADAAPQATLIRLDENVGFARANNLAATKAKGRRLLLLNSDTVVLSGAIDRLVRFADHHEEAQLFGVRTLFPDGSLNPASCWGRPTLWSALCFALGLSVLANYVPAFDPETMRTWRRDTVRRVDIVSGCCLCIDRALWSKLEGFDPAFFMYGEDFDLCMRATKCGAQALICPTARIIHYGGMSERVESAKLVHQMKARVALMRKHWSPSATRCGMALLHLRVLMRTCAFAVACRLHTSYEQPYDRWAQTWAQRDEWRRGFDAWSIPQRGME